MRPVDLTEHVTAPEVAVVMKWSRSMAYEQVRQCAIEAGRSPTAGGTLRVPFETWEAYAKRAPWQRGRIGAVTAIAPGAVEVGLQPRRPGAWIYFLLCGSEVVYVGRSLSINARLGEHQISKEFDRAFVVRIGDGECAELDAAERACIRALRPRLNKAQYAGESTKHDAAVLAALRNGGDVGAAIRAILSGKVVT